MGKFIQQTIASTIGTVIGIILFFLIGTSSLVFLLITSAPKEDKAAVKDKSVLVMDLSQQFLDYKPPSSLSETLAGEDSEIIPLRQVIKAIEAATQDSSIVALFLDGSKDNIRTNSYSNLQEIRQALENFRASGKRIIAYDVNLREKEYYLVSIADTIALNPLGILEMNGLASQQLFLQDALDKYGIGVQVIRVGNYKAAVEPFTRNSFSPENRQQTQDLLGDIWTEFKQKVAKGRNLTPEKLQSLTDTQAFLQPQQAKQAGLIDKVSYLDEIITELKDLTGVKEAKKSFKQISLEKYVQIDKDKRLSTSSNPNIAVVYAQGTIVGGKGGINQIGSQRYAKILRQLRQDPAIKAIVLRINSPGGSATASEIILREIELISQSKPVIVSMGNLAASGGYWLATGGDYIFADSTTITGSIGVFGLFTNIQELANNNGITWDTVKTGKFADINSTVRPKTAEELKIYQNYVNQIYNMFLARVAKARNLPREKVAAIAQGRVWSGKDAQAIGLVDAIGGLEEAIAYAAKQVNLETKDWKIKEYPQYRRLEVEILEKILESDAIAPNNLQDPLTQQLSQLKSELGQMQVFNDPQGVYSILPFGLKIE